MLKSPLCRLLWLVSWTTAAAALAAPHKVRVSDPVEANAMIARGGRLIADYKSFQLIETDEEPTVTAAAGGVELADRLDVIELNARRLNTRSPEVRQLQGPAGSFPGKHLRLIQFAGPVKPEWFEALSKQGLRIVNYVPQNAYLVYGDAPALARMQAWARSAGPVQWEGDYAPEYKIHPHARRTDANGIPQNPGTDVFTVQLVDDAEANAATLALIDRLRLEPIQSQFRVLHFLNLTVRVPPSQLDQISAQPDVVSIQPVFGVEKFDERQSQIVAGNLSSGLPSSPGYLAWLASKGFSQTQFNASGFVVDVSDSGIDNGTTTPGHFGLYQSGNPSQSSRVVYNRLEGTPHMGSTLQGCDGHGTLNSHIVAGYSDLTNTLLHTDAAGYRYGLGVCPFVKVGSSVIFDPSLFTSPSYPDLQSQAYQDGARISANSWGDIFSSAYDARAQAYDALVRDAQPLGSAFGTNNSQQMVIVFAVGNAGPGTQTIRTPGTAKNVISVGASENVRSLSPANGGNDPSGNSRCSNDADTAANSANDIADFSGRGPCPDGRMKPDLVAPGTHITGGVAQSGSATTNGTGSAIACFDGTGVCGLPGGGSVGSTNNFFPLGQQFYTVSSGTSHSTPAVAGACALLRQYFINAGLTPPSPAMTKAYLVSSTRYLTGVSANDNLWSPNQGMGEVDLSAAFDGVARGLHDQLTFEKFTATGQTRSYGGTIADSGKPFRVTLAWTDAPGSTIGNAFNNDLDLTVTIGTNTYRGNVFNGAWSTNGGAADGMNNVESVFLPAGASGRFTVTVSAANINSDGVPNEEPALDQDFALVMYNALAPVIVPDGLALAAETCNPGNGAVDPGEAVTMNLVLRNTGSANTTNLTVTLLGTNGVFFPSGPQNFGALTAGGGSVTQAFSFTAGGVCGGTINPVFQFQDGTAALGSATFTVQLGQVTNSLSENFDSVTAPALPGGWTSAHGGMSSVDWRTSTSAADTLPNAAFTSEPNKIGSNSLTSPIFNVTPGSAELSFEHFYNMEAAGSTGYDGGVLEIKIGTNAFMDILAAGGSFVQGGYNATLSTNYGNPLGGRAAWSGNSSGFITTTVALPPGVAGQTNQLRWRMGTDNGTSGSGWFIDTVKVTVEQCCAAPMSDLAIGQSISPQLLNVGSNLFVTLAITNLGPSTASSVTVTDALPAGLTFVAAISTQGSPTNNGSFVSCAVGTMTNGARVTVTIQATATAAGPWTNSAGVVSALFDPFGINNLASDDFTANGVPTISGISNTNTPEDTTLGPLEFVIGDAETDAASLTLTAGSSNTNLVSIDNIVFGGSDSNRTVTLTPSSDQFGACTITITVSDGMASAGSSFVLTVDQVNDPPILAPISDVQITEGALFLLTNSAFNVETPPQTLTFSLSNAPAGASINPTNGVLSWTPSETQGPGSFYITVIVTDNGIPPLSDQQSFTATVAESNLPPVLTAIANRTIYANTTLMITNVATDSDVPTNTLFFDLGFNSPPSASVDLFSGIFSWTPDDSYADTTNNVTIEVTDDGFPQGYDAKSFSVIVAPPPVIQSITASNNVVTITWKAISGLTYRLQRKNNLDDPVWNDLPPVTASGPTASKQDTIVSGSSHRFYRVAVVP